MKTLPINTHVFFKRAIAVAEHYGFCNVDELCIRDPKQGKHPRMNMHIHTSDTTAHVDHHVLSSVIAHLAKNIELKKRRALMFYTPSTVSIPGEPQTKVSALTLNTIGVQDPLSEIMLLKATISILEEVGMPRHVVRVNSIGDSDSSTRFVREVGALLRARVRDLPVEYADMVRADIGSALATLYENRHPITFDLPSPLDYLTSPSRKYFKEILELLENAGIPFELDDKLYGSHSLYAHTMYEVVNLGNVPEETHVVARGGRYDNLTRAYARGTIPATGIVVAVRTKEQAVLLGKPTRKRPIACLIHIGREARIRSINIVDTFRREKIPIEQCLQFERFSEQIAYAQAQETKYVIILGQREVHENVVIIRNVADRSQRTIPIATLPDFFRAAIV